DLLGSDPVAAFRAVSGRGTDVFARPDTLTQTFPFPSGPMPGAALANLYLMETLVHGWDLATGAGVAYSPDPEVVAAVTAFTGQAIGDPQRQAGLFGPPCPVDEDTDSWTRLLGYLGRTR